MQINGAGTYIPVFQKWKIFTGLILAYHHFCPVKYDYQMWHSFHSFMFFLPLQVIHILKHFVCHLEQNVNYTWLNADNEWNKKAPKVSQVNRQPNQLARNTTVPQSDTPVESCSCTTAVQNALLTYSKAFKFTRSDLLSISLAVSLASLKTAYLAVSSTSLKTVSVIADVVYFLTIIHDPVFGAQLFSIQVMSITCC